MRSEVRSNEGGTGSPARKAETVPAGLNGEPKPGRLLAVAKDPVIRAAFVEAAETRAGDAGRHESMTHAITKWSPPGMTERRSICKPGALEVSIRRRRKHVSGTFGRIE